jgi:hypothetical protein
MSDVSNPSERRRKFLKTITAVGASGLVAGCTGGSNGGDGTTANTQDGTNNDTTAGGSGGGSIKLSGIPIPPLNILETRLKGDQSNVLQQQLSDVDYSLDKFSMGFQGPALLASGQSHMNFDVSALGAARLGPENDVEITIVGHNLNAFPTFYVKDGGPYDPENTGSVQATFDKLDENNARMAIPNWSSGTIPAHQIAVQSLYGKQFAQDQSDFKVVQVEWPAMPQLIKEGDLATGICQAFLGGTTRLEQQGELKPLYWPMDLLPKEGFGIPPLASMPVRTDFFEENREAVEAVMRAYEEELQWLLDDPTGIVSEDPYLGMMNTDGDAELAEYLIQFVLNDSEDRTFEVSPMRKTGYIDDEFIEGVKTYLDNAVELGQVPENWDEYVSFETL